MQQPDDAGREDVDRVVDERVAWRGSGGRRRQVEVRDVGDGLVDCDRKEARGRKQPEDVGGRGAAGDSRGHQVKDLVLELQEARLAVGGPLIGDDGAPAGVGDVGPGHPPPDRPVVDERDRPRVPVEDAQRQVARGQVGGGQLVDAAVGRVEVEGVRAEPRELGGAEAPVGQQVAEIARGDVDAVHRVAGRQRDGLELHSGHLPLGGAGGRGAAARGNHHGCLALQLAGGQGGQQVGAAGNGRLRPARGGGAGGEAAAGRGRGASRDGQRQADRGGQRDRLPGRGDAQAGLHGDRRCGCGGRPQAADDARAGRLADQGVPVEQGGLPGRQVLGGEQPPVHEVRELGAVGEA